MKYKDGTRQQKKRTKSESKEEWEVLLLQKNILKIILLLSISCVTNTNAYPEKKRRTQKCGAVNVLVIVMNKQTAVFFCCRLALHFAAVGIVASKSINISFGISLSVWLKIPKKYKFFDGKNLPKFEVKSEKKKNKKFECCLWNIEEFFPHVKSVTVCFYIYYFFNEFYLQSGCWIYFFVINLFIFLPYTFFCDCDDIIFFKFCAFTFIFHVIIIPHYHYHQHGWSMKQLSPVLLIMMLWDFIIY